MLEPGKKETLYLVKKVEFGVYLAQENRPDVEEKVLLPKKEVAPDAQIGDQITVFLYRDSKDRLIATIREPKLCLGDVAALRVKETGRIGAFLDWGLEKDLLLPFKEQLREVRKGEECLVALYLDKSRRLCATMKLYPYLRTDSPYEKDQKVTGTVYEISKNFGAFVAVDQYYSAMIPQKEPYGNLKIGDQVEARVTEVLPDGKLSLSLREKSYIQMNTDAELLLQLLEQEGGELPIGDKSSPEEIKEQTGMSKNEFKRAVGKLYKQRLIIAGEYRIRKV